MYLTKNKQFLKTKIIATIGKKPKEVFDVNKQLVDKTLDYDKFFLWFIQNGSNRFIVDILRINMAYFKSGRNERKIFNWLEKNKEGIAKDVAVLGDLPGPKIRITLETLRNQKGNIKKSKKILKVLKEHTVFLNFGSKVIDNIPSILVYDKPFSEIVVSIGEDRTIGDYIRIHTNVTIYIGDGDVSLNAIEEKDGIVKCIVEKGGIIIDKRGVTIKGADLIIPSFQETDKKALDFLLKYGNEFLGFIGLSFVKYPEDVLKIKYYIETHKYNELKEKIKKHIGNNDLKAIQNELITQPRDLKGVDDALKMDAQLLSPLVIAKIENRQAWNKRDEILDVADGLMVARGDLALQLDPQEVPSIQKELIKLCNYRGKPVITATEMLSSMEKNPLPKRAEATDVFNAILDGSDAVMLSGETSVGKYPSQAVLMMAKIAEEAEKYLQKPFSDENILKKSNRQHFQEISHGSGYELKNIETRLKKCKEFYEGKIKDEPQILSEDENKWYNWLYKFYSEELMEIKKQRITDSISESACILSEERGYEGIIVSTLTGRSARMISRFRPDVKIIPAVHDNANARKMILSYNSYPIDISMKYKETNEIFKNTDEIFKAASSTAKQLKYLNRNNMVIYVAGTPLWTLGEVNLIQVKRVE